MSDDTISRHAAIGALDSEITVTGRANAKVVQGYVNLVADRIKRLPSAERRGRWKQVGDNTYRCSVCGELSCCCSPYCGECGAKMDEVEDNG